MIRYDKNRISASVTSSAECVQHNSRLISSNSSPHRHTYVLLYQSIVFVSTVRRNHVTHTVTMRETYVSKRLRWSRGSVPAFGTKVRGFKPGRSRRNYFRAKKILSTSPFGKEVKPFAPCRRFTACKRSLNVTVEVGHFQAKFICHFSPK